MDMTEFGSFIHEIDQQYAPAISTPLDSLCGEYKKLKDDIERIASYVAGESGAIHYFMDGAQVAGTRCHSSPGEFPEKLKFTVEGEVRTGNAEAYLAIPVICEVAFPRVGVSGILCKAAIGGASSRWRLWPKWCLLPLA